MVIYKTLQDLLENAGDFLFVGVKESHLIAHSKADPHWAVFDLSDPEDMALYYQTPSFRACCYLDPESLYRISNLTKHDLFSKYLAQYADKVVHIRPKVSIHALHILFLGTQN